MGTVYEARDRASGMRVAVKVVRGHGRLDGKRFAREAELLAELDHPAVVRYVAHGDTGDDGQYLVMEWLDGEDLANRAARAPLTTAESVTLLRSAAEGLAAAHARGMLHRDIKPSNLFLVGGAVDRVKILDFGLARRMDGRALTRTGTILGTLDYMAPEQARAARTLDARADVFSLGCVMYECLTGRPPFSSDHETAVLAKILFEEPPRVRDSRQDVPEVLESLVLRMLDKEPLRRPRDAGALLVELSTLGEIRGSGMPSMVIPSTALTASEQRVVSVVLAAGPYDAALARGEIPPTAVADEDAERCATLQAASAPFGARLEILADGAIVATLAGQGPATDEATRAARCALALRELVLEVPMMLATGRGILGADASRLPVGQVIDRGVRALADAAPGAIRIDEVTAGLLDARMEVVARGEILYLAGERDATGAGRTLLGRPTPCVGRDRELGWLEDILAECTNERVARAVLVTGAAGSGKSRLRVELVSRLRSAGAPLEVLFGRGDPLSGRAPFGMLAGALRRAAGVSDGADLATRQDRLAKLVARRFPADDQRRLLEFLGELAGIPVDGEPSAALAAARDNPILMGDAMRTAFEDWLIEETSAAPVLLVLEDLHAGDVPTVRFVDAALRNLHDRPFLVLALGRPETPDVFPGLWAERNVQHLRLGGLARRPAEALVRGALPELPDEAVGRMIERAEGNPFVLEELVRAQAAGTAGSLPDGVLGLVQVRLDALGPFAKRVLRAASVFGDAFPRAGVLELLGAAEEGTASTGRVTPRLAECLEELISREVLARPPARLAPPSSPDARPSPARTLPGPMLIFRHPLVREAAYEMLTDADRRLGHRLAGGYLERSGDTRAAVLAEHFERGGEPVRAAGWYRWAAAQALEGDDLPAAIELADKGIANGATGESRGAMRLTQAEAHFWRGELPLAIECAARAAEELPAGGPAWYEALGLSIISCGQRGMTERVAALGREAFSQAPDGPRAASAQVCSLCRGAAMLVLAGRHEAVDALAAQIGDATPDLAALDRTAAGWAACVFGVRAHLDGLPEMAVHVVSESVRAFVDAGDRRSECLARSNLAYLWAEIGQPDRGIEEGERAHASAARMGLPNALAYADHNLGYALYGAGRLEEAAEVEARAAALSRDHGDARIEGGSRAYLALIEARRSRMPEAETEARRAVELLETYGTTRAFAVGVLARVLHDRGRTAEALAAAKGADAQRRALGRLDEGEAVLDAVLDDALRAAGEAAEADAVLARARARIQARAESIMDPAMQESYRAREENARILGTR
jgi:tetratricopeptide (TPR) repeat protein